MKSEFIKRSPLWSASKITIIYASISLAYVLFSNQLIGLFAPDVETAMHIAVLKGWAFVSATSLMMFVLLRREVQKYSEAEKALIESQRHSKFLADFLEKSSQPFAVGYPDGRIRDCNSAFLNLVGYGKDELMRMDWGKELTPPEWQAQTRAAIDKLHDTGLPQRFEKEYRRKDGSLAPVEMFVHMQKDESGQPEHYFTFTQDITERKRAERALQDTEARLQAFVSAAFEGICFSENGRVVDCNDQFANMLGYARGELIGTALKDVIAPEAMTHIGRNFSTNREDVFEHEMIRKDGLRITVEAHGKPVLQGERSMRCSVVHDISERKRTEKALKESEEKYRRIVETTNEAIIAVDREKHVILVNQRMADLLGYTVDEIIGQPGESLFFEEDLPDHAGKMQTRRLGESAVYERRLRRKDGNAVWVIVSATAIMDSVGQFEGAFGMCTDITARKKAEEELVVYKQMIASSQEGMCLIGKDYTYQKVNPSYLQKIGLEEASFFGKPVAEVLGQSFFETTIQPRLARCFSGDMVTYSEWFDYPAVGKRYMGITLSPCLNHASEIVGAVAVAHDLTERKQAEDKLREAGTRLDYLVTESPAVVFTYDLKTEPDITYVSRNIAGILGWDPEVFIGNFSFWKECLHPDDLPHVRKGLDRLRVEGRAVFEYRFKNATGAYRRLHDEQRLMVREGGSEEVIGAWWDVTETKRAEGQLVKLREQLQGIMRHSPLPISVVDKSGRFVIGDHALCSLLGIDEQSLPGKSLFDFVPEAIASGHLSKIQRVATTGTAETYNERLSFNGVERAYRTALFPLVEPDGRINSVGVISNDITELEQAQEELKRLAAAIEQSAETVLITDEAGKILYVNPAFESDTGYTFSEAIGQNPRVLKSGKQGAEFYRDMWSTIASGQTWQGDFINKRKDGRTYTERAKISPVRDSSGAICSYVAVMHDVTKELEAEQRYREGQKMQAIGTLAAGIAHDFNNILGLIVGNAEMLLLTGAVEGHAADSANQILLASTRAKGLIKQILTLSKRGRQEKLPLNLRPLMRETADFLRSSLPANIQLVTDFDPDLGLTSADPALMQQAVMNICTNAAQAMEKQGGVLAIRLTNTSTLQESLQLEGTGEPADLVKLSVSDSGVGIADEIKERIFEPYFTTREVGKGQGLGLAVVHGIVTSHGGAVKVDSVVGEGTTFHVYLPRAKGEQKSETGTWQQQLPTGVERVLVVDDERALARVSELALNHLGYKVKTQNGPIEALELFRSDPDAFDLVITDLTMPQINGLRLAADLLRVRPNLPIILCTGYTERVDVQKAHSIGIKEVLMKPVSIRELATGVRRVLDPSRAS
jgi:PAS domain S-box-containing protein